MATSMSTVDAKENFLDIINQVAHSKERVVITRRGKDIAVIIPIEDLQLLQNNQDKSDLAEATESLKEARKDGTITLDQLKNDIG